MKSDDIRHSRNEGENPMLKNTEDTTENEKDGRGRKVDPEVQERRLVTEATEVLALVEQFSKHNLRFQNGIIGALRLADRIKMHLLRCAEARTLLTSS